MKEEEIIVGGFNLAKCNILGSMTSFMEHIKYIFFKALTIGDNYYYLSIIETAR